MKLYKTTIQTGADSFEAVWDGTQADARSTRKDLDASRSPEQISQKTKAETAEIDVPTDKAGLLAWLNANCTGE